jgi:hypothetical protein
MGDDPIAQINIAQVNKDRLRLTSSFEPRGLTPLGHQGQGDRPLGRLRPGRIDFFERPRGGDHFDCNEERRHVDRVLRRSSSTDRWEFEWKGENFDRLLSVYVRYGSAANAIDENRKDFSRVAWGRRRENRRVFHSGGSQREEQREQISGRSTLTSLPVG